MKQMTKAKIEDMSTDEKKLQKLNDLIAHEDRPGWIAELEGERRRLMGEMGLLHCGLCGEQTQVYEADHYTELHCDQCQDILDMQLEIRSAGAE